MTDIKPVDITDTDYQRVFNTLKNLCEKSESYYLNLEDYILIERVFGIEYREFIALIACLKYKEIIKIENKFGTNVSIKMITQSEVK